MDAGIFSPTTKRLYELAQNEAALLAHDYLSTEHLLLAIISLDSDLSDCLFADLSISEDDLRREIGKIIQLGDMPFTPPKKFPLTSHAKRAIEISMSEAGIETGNMVEPEHLLVGLVAEPDNEPTVVTQAFKNCGVEMETLLSLTRRYAMNLNASGNVDSDRKKNRK